MLSEKAVRLRKWLPNSRCSGRGYHARLRELLEPAAELVGEWVTA